MPFREGTESPVPHAGRTPSDTTEPLAWSAVGGSGRQVTGQDPPLRCKRVAAPGRAISGPLQESGSRWAPHPAASDALRSLPAPTATAPRQGGAVSLHRGTGGSKGPKPWRTADRREPLPLGTARARAAFGEMLSHVGERGGPRKDRPPSCSGLRLFTAPLCTSSASHFFILLTLLGGRGLPAPTSHSSQQSSFRATPVCLPFSIHTC